MHSPAKFYMMESWIAFLAGGALILLAFALPLSMTMNSSAARWLVRILGVVVVLCAVTLLVLTFFVKI
jgi:Na+/melibiose symporter-like transporter